MQSRFIRGLLAVVALAAVLAAVLWVSTRPAADPHAATIERLRGELEQDFPGFSVVELKYSRYDPGISFDAFPFDVYTYVLALRSQPSFRVAGRYTLGDYQPEAPKLELLRGNLLSAGKLPPGAVAALAKSWVAAHPGDAISVPSVTTTARSTAWLEVSDAQRRLIAKRIPLDDTYAFFTPSNHIYWMSLDRRTGQWTSLGDSASLVEKYAR